ncbi:DUF5131 family protein [Porcipelethomonas sp.]|uniref:DUF5131 family protein n=1 Tax=Porcipelethomonas sp. TaxID=2981675 RepID=UPI00304EC4B4
MQSWNPWHGCHKISEGCQNCYVYRTDSRYGKDSGKVEKTSNFDMPLNRDRSGEWKLQNDGFAVATCLTSDFFIDEADQWRSDIWQIIKRRRDLDFFIITKRIHRFYERLPEDWGNGYDNVIIGCTCECQRTADFRLPIFLEAPIKHKVIICAPLIEEINLSEYLNERIEQVSAGGESGENARICKYEWILSIREQCIEKNVDFHFHQTGAKLMKDGVLYRIPRKYQHLQAKKAGINIRNNLLKY